MLAGIVRAPQLHELTASVPRWQGEIVIDPNIEIIGDPIESLG
jgi:hypothetical protein